MDNATPDDLYLMGRREADNAAETDLFSTFDTPEAELADGGVEAVEPPIEAEGEEYPDPVAEIPDVSKVPYLADNGNKTWTRTDEKWEGFTYIEKDADLGFIDRNKITLKNDVVRMKNLSLGEIGMSILAPFSAFSNAALAPMADTDDEGFESFGTAAKAFMDTFNLQDSVGRQGDYAQGAVDNFVGEIDNDLLNSAATTLLSVVTDPSVVIGTGAIKTVERGLKQGLRNRQVTTPWQAGIDEFLGLGSVPDTQAIQLREFAKAADAGDKQALAKLNDILEDPDIKEQIKSVEEIEARRFVDDLVGDVEGPKIKVEETNDDFVESLSTNVNASRVSINLGAYNTEGDLDLIVDQMGTLYKEEYRHLRKKSSKKEIIDDSQIIQLGDLIGKPVTNYSAEEAYALRHMMISSAQLVKETIAAYKKDPLQGDKGFLAVTKSLTLLKSLMAKTTRLESHAGRLLNAQRAHAEASRSSVAQLKESISDLRADPTLSDEKLELLSQATPREIALMTKDVFKPKMADYFFEVFTNAILSGPQTHAINITSNASNLILRPTEKALEGLSAAARGDFKKASENLGQSKEMLAAIMGSMKDVIGIIGRTTDRNTVLPNHLINSHEVAAAHYRPKITSENLGGQGGPLGSLIDYLGNGVRFFGNSLVTQDQIFKMINYRMTLRSEAVSAANRLAKTPEEYDQLLAQHIRSPDIENIRKAVDVAEYYTFTNQLGQAGTALKVLVKRVPGGRWVLPFVQTPTNIVKFGVRHSVFGNMFKDLKNIGEAGPKGDLARAKIAIGTALPMAFIGAMGDNITGAINENTPAGRFKGKETPPYSFKIGDTWISYANIEPFRSIMGLMIGLKDGIDQLDWDMDQEMIGEMTATVVAPFLTVTTENWMMPQISEMMRTLEHSKSANPEQMGMRLKRMAASMMVPNLFAQSNRMFDKTVRDADTFMEMLKARIPGLSETVPAYRNLWGDEAVVPPGLGPDLLSPFPYKEGADPIAQEIIRLEDLDGLVDLPGLRREINGIQLNNVQKSRFQELRGKGSEEFGIPPLKETLAKVMNSEEYREGSDALKGKFLTYQINAYSDLAKDLLLQEDEALREQILELRQAQIEALSK